jgi:hypothetical protein
MLDAAHPPLVHLGSLKAARLAFDICFFSSHALLLAAQPSAL